MAVAYPGYPQKVPGLLSTCDDSKKGIFRPLPLNLLNYNYLAQSYMDTLIL